ncbi:protein-export chaperone SecB [Wenxinia saemankumensis]|uniref:Protein-export protein SecB n=1 Tax=Wenxinia saemankumensis TaxID=1447782 RepID=A0A1M6G290_9RHOB|nr:protein-export chaperone SecB [Wenxinia saemankumensis]SHJ04095.1 protein translocase subunit secB [Wenxinia saemankumensis]
MGETPDTPQGDAAAGGQQAQKVNMKVLTQYIRDLSFENGLARNGITGQVEPDISVQVKLDARKRGADNQYEVITKLTCTSKSKSGGETLFVLELEYAGIFQVEGVPEAQLHPYLLIECPRMTFPYVRRIVGDLTRDGGFPPLNLDQIDFLAIYRQEIQRRMEAQQAAGAPTNGATQA